MSDHDTPERGASRYPQIVRAVAETPWAIVPERLVAIKEMLALRAAGERFSDEDIQARVGASPARKDIYMAGSTAILPIYGVLVPKADLFSSMSGGSSVQRLSQAFDAAISDPEVSAVVLEIDSPGGQTSMIPEFAAEIRAARGKKPIVAVANTHASSAAYWLGSQADEFVVTPSGRVGSIGVFAAHEDISAKQEQEGIKTTLISAGKHKVDQSPFGPLSEEAKADVQAQVDEAYQTFTADVAKGRRVTVDMVRNGYGEGRVLSAKSALREGMVDRIATLQSTVEGLASSGTKGTVVVTLSGLYTPTAEQVSQVVAVVVRAGPIVSHSTATSDGPWDGPQAKASLREGEAGSYYASAFAWRDDSADSTLKGSYKFIHHEVASNGNVGAANMTACSNGIAVLNGGRRGTTIPDADRQGVYDHLAKHLRDGGKEPPPLQGLSIFEAAASGLSFADEALAVRDAAEELVIRLASLAEVERGRLTTAKRLSLTACPEALRAAAEQIDDVLAATDPDKHRNALLAEVARFEARRATVGGRAR